LLLYFVVTGGKRGEILVTRRITYKWYSTSYWQDWSNYRSLKLFMYVGFIHLFRYLWFW